MEYFEELLSAHNDGTMPEAFAGYILGFLKRLHKAGYTEGTLKHYASSSIHFSLWLGCRGLTATDIGPSTIERFRSHRCRCPGSRRGRRISQRYSNQVHRFVDFLEEQGLVSSAPSGTLPGNLPLDEYVSWLRQHAGLAESTIRRHKDVIARLLPSLGEDPQSYDAALVRNALIADSKGRSRGDTKRIATALRSYLRFLAAQGMCRPDLDRAVPTIPQWRLSSLPRYLPAEQIERIINACDLTTPAGLRDRAILLLLGRLGLRAGDIVNLRLNDISWDEGTMRVIGKGRCEARLPLPQDAGNALLAYLEQRRPVVPRPQVFLRSMAPYDSFSCPSAITCIVRRAITRAGIINAPTRGARLLRHSVATSMLRAGATLEVIGTVLRHRSLDTTAHYAKVDVATLREVAQPWPECAAC